MLPLSYVIRSRPLVVLDKDLLPREKIVSFACLSSCVAVPVRDVFVHALLKTV